MSIIQACQTLRTANSQPVFCLKWAGLVLALLISSQSVKAQAGSQTANLGVSVVITASCTIAQATAINFGSSVTSTSLLTTALTANGTATVTCSNTAPFAVGMSTGANASGSQNRMISGSSYINYNLYTSSALSTPFTTAATNSTCTTSGQCFTGTGTGVAQTITIYGQVPTVTTAPAAGTYTDTVTMTVIY